MILEEKMAKKILIYSIMYWLSFWFSRCGLYTLSALALIILAIWSYYIEFRDRKIIVDAFGLFSLTWIGGQGVACLQLSNIQTDWSIITWFSFYLAYCGVFIGVNCKCRLQNAVINNKGNEKRLKNCILIMALISMTAFLMEAVVVGYIPLFVDFAHAYSYFHVSGVHYFTVSCTLIPALSIIYFQLSEKSKKDIVFIILCNAVTAVVCVLTVSRFQLVFGVGLAVIEYFLCSHKIQWKYIAGVIAIACAGYGILSIFRNHDAVYLNDIFEMKERNTPIIFSQPYIYIVNNYENFNCLVTQLARHTYGLRELFPIFALTGLKFIVPELTNYPDYVAKAELNTRTMFYDAYYDFGIAGVFLFAVLIGILIRRITVMMQQLTLKQNPILYFFYAQITVYCTLSFFTTWFSSPTTWFWLALTMIMYLYVNGTIDSYIIKRKNMMSEDRS